MNNIKMKLFLALVFCTQFAWGHKTSDSFINITHENHSLKGEWRVPLDALDSILGRELNLDNNKDDQITWGELLLAEKQIKESVFSQLRFELENQVCKIKPDGLKIDKLSSGTYLYFSFVPQCNALITESSDINLHYNLFFDLDPLHRGLVNFKQIESNGDEIISSYVLSPESFTTSLFPSSDNKVESFKEFVKEGVWHIWIGIDHILFLLALLIPSVFVFKRSPNSIRTTHQTLRPVLRDIAKVVTGFTLAHSVTLSLASLKIVVLPSIFVESVIAMSVVLGGLLILSARFQRYRWQVACIFGLIHGFGFASVLGDLNLAASAFGISLLAFNVGVELGQLAIVGVLLPLIYGLKNRAVYTKVVVPVCASAMVGIGSIWLLERSLNIQLI